MWTYDEAENGWNVTLNKYTNLYELQLKEFSHVHAFGDSEDNANDVFSSITQLPEVCKNL